MEVIKSSYMSFISNVSVYVCVILQCLYTSSKQYHQHLDISSHSPRIWVLFQTLVYVCELSVCVGPLSNVKRQNPLFAASRSNRTATITIHFWICIVKQTFAQKAKTVPWNSCCASTCSRIDLKILNLTVF
jgi:hypothetical protein